MSSVTLPSISVNGAEKVGGFREQTAATEGSDSEADKNPNRISFYIVFASRFYLENSHLN
jgi:hypothetical protein